MKIQDHVKPIEKKARDSFAKMLRDPDCWSEPLLKETLTKVGSAKPFTIEDIKSIVKSYMGILANEVGKK